MEAPFRPKGTAATCSLPDGNENDDSSGERKRMTGAQRALAVVVWAVFSASALARTVEGKFGRALVANSTAHADVNPVYGVVPITVECWAKVPAKSAEVVIIANEPRNSASHWE